MTSTTAAPPSTFMGTLNPNAKSSLPTRLTKQSAIATGQSTAASFQNQNERREINYLEDETSIAIFTAVGHMGLFLVLRPMVRYCLRSFLFKSKIYLSSASQNSSEKQHLLLSSSDSADTSNTTTNTNTKNNKNKNKKKKSSHSSLLSESEIAEEISNNNNNDRNDKSKSRKKKKAIKSLATISTGICGPYGEILSTFSTLAGISYIAHPTHILLYFGVSYPAMPFILRVFATLNDPKSKLTVSRVGRLTAKSLIVTSGFGLSMAFAGAYFQNVPFLNIMVLSFWDSFTDYLISDGPSK